jgi:DNA adenine methylase
MRYLGGKVRQAKMILSEVRRIGAHRNTYIEPFIGGGSVTAEACKFYKRVVASDVEPSLVALWNAVIFNNWEPPTIAKSTYEHVRKSTRKDALAGWCAFALSYNGKKWAGYGPTAAGRDYAAESWRALQDKAAKLRGRNVHVACHSYLDVQTDEGCVVFCDPPYADTTGYATEFDHAEFWGWANRVSEVCPVLVTEYTVPADWHVVTSWARAATVDAKKTARRVEVLAVHPRWAMGGP